MPISGMQKFFNKSVLHLRKQGRQAIQGLSCKYRADNGDRCAIGCNIPNKLYQPRMEGYATFNLLKDFPNLKNHFIRVYGYEGGTYGAQWDIFLSRVQGIHDSIADWDRQLEPTVMAVAREFNLTIPKTKY